MSRQRFIYPEIWRSEQFLSLSIEARLLFIGIFSTADDYGRHKASALSLKAEVFPADACTPEQITAWRSEIAERGMIRLYADDDGAEILDIPSWAKFQKPRHISDSRMPEYPGAGEVTTAAASHRQTPGETPSTPGAPPADDGSGVVWRGVEKSGVESPPSNRPLPGDVLRAAGVTEATTGMISNWQERHGDFRGWGQLCEKIVAHDKTDPIGLLAHIIEIDNSPSIRNRPATLLKRMVKPSPGTKRRVPADKWHAKAKELIHGSPEDREKSEPEHIGATLDNADNESFDQADDPKTAIKVWATAKNEFDVWNGYDPAERLKATAEARGKMLTHDGRVRVLAAIFDAITATKIEPEKRWAAFRKKLKGRGGGSPDGRRWAKGITG